MWRTRMGISKRIDFPGYFVVHLSWRGTPGWRLKEESYYINLCKLNAVGSNLLTQDQFLLSVRLFLFLFLVFVCVCVCSLSANTLDVWISLDVAFSLSFCHCLSLLGHGNWKSRFNLLRFQRFHRFHSRFQRVERSMSLATCLSAATCQSLHVGLCVSVSACQSLFIQWSGLHSSLIWQLWWENIGLLIKESRAVLVNMPILHRRFFSKLTSSQMTRTVVKTVSATSNISRP